MAQATKYSADTNRFDVPTQVRDFIALAVEVEIMDGADIFALALRFGKDWREMLDEVIEWAFNCRHTPEGRMAHARLVAFRDEAGI